MRMSGIHTSGTGMSRGPSVHFMSEKISQIKEQGESYFTTANLSESVAASKTLEPFGGQKKRLVPPKELPGQRFGKCHLEAGGLL